MYDTVAATAISNLDLPKLVMAIGGLGTAAYGMVDVTKSFGGGISNRGFGDIRKVVSKFIPDPGERGGPHRFALFRLLSLLFEPTG